MLNLNGGPWKKARVLSSLAVTIRKGRSERKSTELMVLLWPMISPTEVPVSELNTCPNLKKMPCLKHPFIDTNIIMREMKQHADKSIFIVVYSQFGNNEELGLLRIKLRY